MRTAIGFAGAAALAWLPAASGIAGNLADASSTGFDNAVTISQSGDLNTAIVSAGNDALDSGNQVFVTQSDLGNTTMIEQMGSDAFSRLIPSGRVTSVSPTLTLIKVFKCKIWRSPASVTFVKPRLRCSKRFMFSKYRNPSSPTCVRLRPRCSIFTMFLRCCIPLSPTFVA